MSWLLNGLLGGVAKLLRGLVADWRRDRALREAGRHSVQNEHLREAIDAEERMDAVPDPGRDDVVDRLRDGRF